MQATISPDVVSLFAGIVVGLLTGVPVGLLFALILDRRRGEAQQPLIRRVIHEHRIQREQIQADDRPRVIEPSRGVAVRNGQQGVTRR